MTERTLQAASTGPGDDAVEDCARYEDGRRVTGRLAIADLADAVAATTGFVWLSLREPSAAAMAAVARQVGLPELAVEDAVQAHQRPKLETYDDSVFTVLKPVHYAGPGQALQLGEVAVFLAGRLLVTVRHGRTEVLEQVRRELDAGHPPFAAVSPSGVLHHLADVVVDAYEAALDGLNTEVDDVEEQVFGRDGSDHAERIYQLKRHTAELRRVVTPLAVPMQRLAGGSVAGVDPSLAPYFRDVYDHVLRAGDAVEAADRVLSDVLQADMSQISVRQNEIALRQNEAAAQQNEDMRKISAWAAIGLIPTSVAGIYGMNFDVMPGLHARYGFAVAMIVIVLACALLYRVFRRNGWL